MILLSRNAYILEVNQFVLSKKKMILYSCGQICRSLNAKTNTISRRSKNKRIMYTAGFYANFFSYFFTLCLDKVLDICIFFLVIRYCMAFMPSC